MCDMQQYDKLPSAVVQHNKSFGFLVCKLRVACFASPIIDSVLYFHNMSRDNRIYIVGAGQFGRAIAKEIGENHTKARVIAFLDDDRDLIGTLVDGIPVLGPIETCVELLDHGHNSEALITLPSAARKKLRNVYEALQRAGFSKIRILPSVSQIITADPHVVLAREIDPQDLLGREPVLIDLRESLSYVRGKRVLITGAGGSIGAELSRQMLHGGAERLYLLDHGETSIWAIENELKYLQDAGIGEKTTIIPIVGELQDGDYVDFLLDRLKADVVFHGAAHKHVPMMEQNPIEVIKNNVLGTRNIVNAVARAGTQRFVLVSTDKAVAPASVYGVSKSIAESIVLAQRRQNCIFMVVRFGNVLGSRGSIMPLFKKQILAGGPVTITDPEAQRWFMTIPEAVSLILKTACFSGSNGLYVLDMGDPVRIVDLARQMIRFYGYEEDSIPITFIGMRPGEKKIERLWSDEEKPVATEYPRIMKVEFPELQCNLARQFIKEIEPVISLDSSRPELFRNRHHLREIIKLHFPNVQGPVDEPEY